MIVSTPQPTRTLTFAAEIYITGLISESFILDVCHCLHLRRRPIIREVAHGYSDCERLVERSSKLKWDYLWIELCVISQLSVENYVHKFCGEECIASRRGPVHSVWRRPTEPVSQSHLAP